MASDLGQPLREEVFVRMHTASHNAGALRLTAGGLKLNINARLLPTSDFEPSVNPRPPPPPHAPRGGGGGANVCCSRARATEHTSVADAAVQTA